MRVWRLSVLGRCQLHAPSGAAVAFSTRKAPALIVYLACQPHRRASRERLAAMFWPDGDASQARLNLRKALSTIRQAQLAHDGPPLILADGELLEIPVDALVTDLDDFERAGVESPERLIETYAGAFLEDFSVRGAPDFDDWVALQRQQVHQRVTERLAQALDGALAADQPLEPVAATALGLLALDPLNERAHRALMRVRQRQGRRTAAIQQYQSLTERLKRELGIEPESETVALFREIEQTGRLRPQPPQPPPPDVHRTQAAGAPAPPRRRPWRRWAAACAVLIAVGAVGVTAMTRLNAQSPPELDAVRTITSTRFDFFQPALSPDGAFVAYGSSHLAPGNADLFLQSVDGAPPIRLTTDPRVDDNPAWSRDGNAIAFTRRGVGQNPTCWIVTRGVPRGAERTVGRCPGGLAARMAWSADGRGLYLIGRSSPGQPIGLLRMDLATGGTVPVTRPPPGSWGDHEPVLSPDGRLLAFLRRSTWTAANVFALDLASGETRPLTNETARVWGLAWGPGGRGVLFSSDRRGDTGLWWVAWRGSGEPRRLSGGLLDFRGLAAGGGDNRRLVFEALHDRSVLLGPTEGTGTRPGPLAGLPPPGPRSSDWFPATARDGALVFASNRSGSEQLWMSAGGRLRQLTDGPMLTVAEPRWSPDGRRIAFIATRFGRSDILLIPRDGGPATSLTDDAAEEASPAWSADGRYLYFGSRRSGAWRIWRAPTDGSAPAEAVTGEGTRSLRLGAGDKTIYVVRDDRSGIWRAALTEGRINGGWTQVEPTLAPSDMMNWDLVGGSLYYLSRAADGSGGEIRRLGLETGRNEVVADAAGLFSPAAFSVRPGGGLILTKRDYEMNLMVADMTAGAPTSR